MLSFHDDILQSLAVLKKGGVILYPTDTVWGIGCDATHPEAVERIFKIKGRVATQSMLILVDSPDMLSSYVHSIPDIALQLMVIAENPLSIIYPHARNVAANLVAEDYSIGIRVVKDPFCKQLIQKFGKPVVSTSANVSGEKTPGIFNEIPESIRRAVDYVVCWRQKEYTQATASSIVKLNEDGTFHVIRM